MLFYPPHPHANYKSETKNIDFLMFHYVFLAMASKEERRHQLIILRVCNIIFSEFLLFSVHSLCYMQDTKSKINI